MLFDSIKLTILDMYLSNAFYQTIEAPFDVVILFLFLPLSDCHETISITSEIAITFVNLR